MSTVVQQPKINQAYLDSLFLTGPGEDIVAKTILQMQKVPQFISLFGPYGQDLRWADYQRMDWSIRQLPVISIFEAQSEEKQSDQAYLNGTIQFQVFWPASFRRSDLARVPAAFKAIMQNFFHSQFVRTMLDEQAIYRRPEKVYGLNRYGKEMTWTPQVEGLVESELVPMTLLDVRYRLDLRRWYDELEFEGRTEDNPFQVTLAQLGEIKGEYDGVPGTDATQIDVVVLEDITVSNPPPS